MKRLKMIAGTASAEDPGLLGLKTRLIKRFVLMCDLISHSSSERKMGGSRRSKLCMVIEFDINDELFKRGRLAYY